MIREPTSSSPCEDENGNIIDPITSEIITPEKLVVLKESSKTYCFDIETLSQLEKMVNPFTQEKFPLWLIDKIEQYRNSNVLSIFVLHNRNRIKFELKPTTTLGEVILAIFRAKNRSIGSFDDIADIELEPLYNYDIITTTIRDLPKNLVIKIKRPLDRSGLLKLLRFSKLKDYEWLMDRVNNKLAATETLQTILNERSLDDVIALCEMERYSALCKNDELWKSVYYKYITSKPLNSRKTYREVIADIMGEIREYDNKLAYAAIKKYDRLFMEQLPLYPPNTKFDGTPLIHLAYPDLDMIIALINKGANPSILSNGKSILKRSIDDNYKNITNYMLSITEDPGILGYLIIYDKVEYLDEYAKNKKIDFNKWVELALTSGSPKVLIWLAGHGHFPSKDFDINEEFIKAVDDEKYSILETLLSLSANINYKDENGNTALHNAVESENMKMVKELLRLGANKEIKNEDNFTPYQLAKDIRAKGIIQLLQ